MYNSIDPLARNCYRAIERMQEFQSDYDICCRLYDAHPSRWRREIADMREMARVQLLAAHEVALALAPDLEYIG